MVWNLEMSGTGRLTWPRGADLESIPWLLQRLGELAQVAIALWLAWRLRQSLEQRSFLIFET